MLAARPPAAALPTARAVQLSHPAVPAAREKRERTGRRSAQAQRGPMRRDPKAEAWAEPALPRSGRGAGGVRAGSAPPVRALQPRAAAPHAAAAHPREGSHGSHGVCAHRPTMLSAMLSRGQCGRARRRSRPCAGVLREKRPAGANAPAGGGSVPPQRAAPQRPTSGRPPWGHLEPMPHDALAAPQMRPEAAARASGVIHPQMPCMRGSPATRNQLRLSFPSNRLPKIERKVPRPVETSAQASARSSGRASSVRGIAPWNGAMALPRLGTRRGERAACIAPTTKPLPPSRNHKSSLAAPWGPPQRSKSGCTLDMDMKTFLPGRKKAC